VIESECEVGIENESGGKKEDSGNSLYIPLSWPLSEIKLRRTQTVDSPTALVNRHCLLKRVRESECEEREER
jgi:hypothetical protein